MIERGAVIAEARKHLGVRWQHLGRSNHGVDCVGLVVLVCLALDLSQYDLKTYPREPKSSEFLGHFLSGGGQRVAINEALPGDLMLFREQRYPCHVSFLSETTTIPSGPERAVLRIPTIIHAHATRRVVLEEPLVGEWLQKRVAAIRLPGVV